MKGIDLTRRVDRDHRRRAPRRLTAGDGDGHWRIADRRPAERPPSAGHRRRHPSELPTSRSYNDVLQLVPGVVAGDGQVQLRPAMLLFTAHGGNAEDGRLTVDGINTGASRGGAGVSGYIPDMQNTAGNHVHDLR